MYFPWSPTRFRNNNTSFPIFFDLEANLCNHRWYKRAVSNNSNFAFSANYHRARTLCGTKTVSGLFQSVWRFQDVWQKANPIKPGNQYPANSWPAAASWQGLIKLRIIGYLSPYTCTCIQRKCSILYHLSNTFPPILTNTFLTLVFLASIFLEDCTVGTIYPNMLFK